MKMQQTSEKTTALSGTCSGYKKRTIFACDFETTVYSGQDHTEVWSAALVPLYTEDVIVMHSIDDFFTYLFSLKENMTLYFHNLKFDGTFILYWLKEHTSFTEAIGDDDDFLPNKMMPNESYKYLISLMGDWYTITIKHNGHIIEIRDSLKLLPFSLKVIGESFGTKHQKLDMLYEGFRYAGCEISDSELEYIRNDVLVLKEALEIMFDKGMDKLTIGSCCLNEFKSGIDKQSWMEFFPDVYKLDIPKDIYGSTTAGDYIRKSYKGGWCYVAKGKEQQIHENGITLDVNSLYPSMMHSESGNAYPIGWPHFWQGAIPEDALKGDRYYFVRLRTRFKLRKGMLPFIQVKNSFLYRPNECLESSDVIIRKAGKVVKRYTEYMNPDGTHNDGRLEMTLTKTDYELIQKHYEIYDTEILDGCWFHTEKGLFDLYIDYWKKVKQENKGAIRQLAKLMLNNLYGKLAASPDSSYKKAVMIDGDLTFVDVRKRDKKPGYIPIGSAIPSYARRFTITAAQMNYYGPNKPGFIYADTDSIHCDIPIEKVKGVRLDPKAFCCWKHETSWDHGWFTRQKTYIEHVFEKDGAALDIPFYDIKCAGMPARCKYLLNMSLTGTTPVESTIPLNAAEQEFVSRRRTISDFCPGLHVPGKLIQRRIPGGCVLYETTFEMM